MPSKKSVKKKKVSRSQEVVIKVMPTGAVVSDHDLLPEKQNSKYMIPSTWIQEKQVLAMVSKTPMQHRYKRPGKGGQVFEYVTGHYITKVLNFVFGWMWDFEIIAHGVQGDQVWVQGKLTVKDSKGNTITKSQFGRADIKFKKDTKIMLDFGNDLKAATTDALKKCASQFGIASDVYGKQELVEAGKKFNEQDEHNQDTKSNKPEGVDVPEYVCTGCDTPITKQEAEFSKKVFGKHLCRECQKHAKRK